jgi:N-acetylglucosamine transport system substrate-binding protein
MIKRIQDDGYMLEGSSGMNHLQAQAALMMDRALFMPNGIWIENEMISYPRTENFHFVLMAVPAFESGIKRYMQISYEQIMIPRGAKNTDAAAKVLRFLYSDESVKIFAEKSNGVIPLVHALELGKPYMDDAVSQMYAMLENDTITAYLPSFLSTSTASTTIVSEQILSIFANKVLQEGESIQDWAEEIKILFSTLRNKSGG